MRPRWAEIEKENPWLTTEYIDFDKDKEMVNKYGISSGVLPVFVFLNKDEKEILRLSGEVEKKELIKEINTNKDK